MSRKSDKESRQEFARLKQLEEAHRSQIGDLAAKLSDTEVDLNDAKAALAALDLHPCRKLLDEKRDFIMITQDEPYYIDAYRLVRQNEMRRGGWTPEDEKTFRAAVDRWLLREAVLER